MLAMNVSLPVFNTASGPPLNRTATTQRPEAPTKPKCNRRMSVFCRAEPDRQQVSEHVKEIDERTEQQISLFTGDIAR